MGAIALGSRAFSTCFHSIIRNFLGRQSNSSFSCNDFFRAIKTAIMGQCICSKIFKQGGNRQLVGIEAHRCKFRNSFEITNKCYSTQLVNKNIWISSGIARTSLSIGVSCWNIID
jgi:hypothetical protein